MAAVMVVIYIPNDESIEEDPADEELERGEDNAAVASGESENEGTSHASPAAEEPVPEPSENTGPSETTTNAITASDSTPLIGKAPKSSHSLETDTDSANLSSPESADPSVRDPTGTEKTSNSSVKSREKVKFSISEQDSVEDIDANRYSIDSFPLEQALQGILVNLEISRDSWIKTDDKNFWQVSFIIPTTQCDIVLKRLAWIGIGNSPDTSVSLFPANIHYEGFETEVPEEEKDIEDVALSDKRSVDEKTEFIKSIKSRLTVAQVVESVKNNAAFTFDFLVLIILASMIAALGLAENSSVVLVASMLVSPLMGPIMGGTFGVVIRNGTLWRLGVKNELIGLAICVFMGFLFGLVMAGVNSNGASWGSSDSWPTSEMHSRGQVRSLWVGILIALPSGAGVALSILGGNTGSLVGVAISASLLPPAVNAGMLWAYAIVAAFHPPPTEAIKVFEVNVNDTIGNNTELLPSTQYAVPDCPALIDNNYEFVYRCNMASEAAILGMFSLLLTLLNIACIIMMGILVLRIKEVIPELAVSDNLEVFWKKDIKIARDVYKTLRGQEQIDMAKMAKKIAQEFKEKEEIQNGEAEVHNVISDLNHSSTFQNIVDRGPAIKRPVVLRQLSLQTHQTLGTGQSSPLNFSPPTQGRFSMYASNPNASEDPQVSPPIFNVGSPTYEKGPFHFPRRRHLSGRRDPRHKLQHQQSAPAFFKYPGLISKVPSTKMGRFEITPIQEAEGKERSGSVASSAVAGEPTIKPIEQDDLNIDAESTNGDAPRYSPTSSLV